MSDYATHIPVSSPDPTGIQTLIPSFAYEPPADALVPSPWELPVDSMTEAGSRSSRRTLDAGKMAQVVQRAGGTGLEVATRLHRLATVRPSGATTPQTKVQLLPNHKWHRGDGTHRRSHVQSPSPLRIENLMDDLLVEEVPSRSSLKSHPSRKSNKSIGTAIRARAYLAEFKQTKKRHLYHQRASVTLKAQGMPSQARKGPTPVVHRYRERESWKERISTLGVPHIGGAVPVAVPASRAPAVPITQRTVASAVDAMNRSNAIIRAAAPPFVPRSPPVPQYLAANFQGIGGRPLTNPPPRATPLSPTPLPPRPTRPSPNMQSGAFIRPLVPVDAIAKPQINNFPPVIAIPKGPPPRLPAELTYEALSKHVSHGGLVRVHQANSASPLQWTGSRSSSGFGAGVFKGMSPNAYSAAMSQQRKGPWDGPWVTETVHRHITERSDEDTPWISGTFSLNWALWAIVKALAEGSTAVHLSVISPTDEIRFLPTEVLHHTRGDVRSQEAATIRRAAERGEVLFYGRIFADSIQADLVWTPETIPFELPARFWRPATSRPLVGGWMSYLCWNKAEDWVLASLKLASKNPGTPWTSQPVHSISHDWPPPIEEIEEISLAPHLLASSPTRTSQTTFPLEAVLVEVDDSPEQPRRVTELDEIGLVLPPPLVPTRVSAALIHLE